MNKFVNMSEPLLSVKNIYASAGQKSILQGLDLDIDAGEVHVLMGPNGSGKSTLAAAVMGSPHVSVTSGNIFFNGEDIITCVPEERAKKGIYLGFQYPPELPGVGMVPFLRSVLASRGEKLLSEAEFKNGLEPATIAVGLPAATLERNVNEGFSGGEKKRNEIFQLSVIKPRLAILDEFDSGLDVDGIRAAAAALNVYMEEPGRSLLLITHYGHITEYLNPDVVHVMRDGRIVERGGPELISRIENQGFNKTHEE